MKILIAPDKFKGSLTGDEVAEAIERGVRAIDPEIETIVIPLADGGEGSLAFLQMTLHLDMVEIEVEDPLGRPINVMYGIDGGHAYIELAAASGLLLLDQKDRSPLNTSSFGTGQMIAHAIEQGAKQISLFVGGSATNDGGMGIAAALGCRFLDINNNVLSPIGANLLRIKEIDCELAKQKIGDCKITVFTDVSNVLCGSQGAAYTYAPQKGANSAEVEILDRGLKNLAQRIELAGFRKIHDLEGGGAAGGIAAGLVGLLNADLSSAIHVILDICQIDELIKGVDLIITGEGKVDQSSLDGKLLSGLVKQANRSAVPIMVVCGQNELAKSSWNALDIIDVSEISILASSEAESMLNARALIQKMICLRLPKIISRKIDP